VCRWVQEKCILVDGCQVGSGGADFAFVVDAVPTGHEVNALGVGLVGSVVSIDT
jgi:hypothetical protein